MIKDLAVGTSELIKKFDGYEDALNALKEEFEAAQAKEEDKVDGQE